MSLFAVQGEVQMKRATAAITGAVAEAGGSGRFADDAVINVDAFLRELGEDGFGAVSAVAFFIAGE